METSDRQGEILRIVQAQGFATIDTLARQFDVSAQTIRRDIIHLHNAQLLQRFHGGAGIAEATVRLGYEQKRAAETDAKERIGRKAASVIPDGASVFLDVGTTVESAARALLGKSSLQVFTSSARVAMIFAGHDSIAVFLTGGRMRGADGSMIGETAVSQVLRVRPDFAVIGYSGFDDDGTLMDFDFEKIAVKKAAIDRARHSIALGDSSKYGRSALVRLAPVGAFRFFVCDRPPPPLIARELRSGTAEFLLAD